METIHDVNTAGRRLPVGAELLDGEGAHFRVWAPLHRLVHVVLENTEGGQPTEHQLAAEAGGYFAGVVPSARAGLRYRYRLGDSDRLYPDPASRFQPDGPHGASQLVDPTAFLWHDAAWPGVPLESQVLYELHIGTFTQAGTWSAAIEKLPVLAALGITTIEVMPVADFAGQFGWGYDGVNLYAPTRLYGEPDDFRRFVDRSHALGLGVILDVVYNHFGPDGNFLSSFASGYLSTRHHTEWGEALNFDDDAAAVRELIVCNAVYWVTEFHLDGLRFDATQQIFDQSDEHILSEIVDRARAAAPHRTLLMVAENEPQHTRLIRRREDGGYGLDALWNDDFHHAARVRLTGQREAYYTDYTGTPQELISLAKRGFLYQGQRYSWQKKPRGTPSMGLRPAQFITFLENHDQISNAASGRGERVHQLAAPGSYRALTAFWLLAPGTPMLFQGQEFAASAPFLYFADHPGDLGAAVRTGRAEFMSQFPSLASRDVLAALPDPGDRSTFERCKLSDVERVEHRTAMALHRDLLRMRREDVAFGKAQQGWFDGAVLAQDACVLRFFSADPYSPASAPLSFVNDRLVIVNLGVDVVLHLLPEPLLAPPEGTVWEVRWSSEDPAYGGNGTAIVQGPDGWRLPGQATLVFAPRAI